MAHAVSVRRRCRQLFFVFAGAAGGVTTDPSVFLKTTRLLERNVVLLRDGAGDRYRHSREVPDLNALVLWQRARIAELPHVTEVYCIGASLAGYTAAVTGHLLCADAVWAFAPPTLIAKVGVQKPYRDLAVLLSQWNGRTQYHVLYNRSWASDRVAAERIATLPGVVLHPQEGRGHLVVEHLARTGALQSMLPPLAPSEGSQEARSQWPI
jgi:hypothetical protein